MKEQMEELYVEGLASKQRPPPCSYDGNVMTEALDGGVRGRGIELRKCLQNADPVPVVGRQHAGARYASTPRSSAESVRPLARAQTFMHENREIPAVNGGPLPPLRAVKADEAVDRHARRREVGRGRSTDEAPKASAEVTEGRPETSGNLEGTTTSGTQSPDHVTSGLLRVRERATEQRKCRFTGLLHHMTVGMLEDAYRALKPHAAPGVDGVTWQEYGEGLRAQVVDLHARVHGGRYRAQPSRRVWIPKSDGRQRPLGVAAVEDKIVQLAVTWILNAIHETDFAGFSYGFRPGRGQRNALDALWICLLYTSDAADE